MFEDLEDMAALDGLILQEGLGDLVEGVALLLDDLPRADVLLLGENQGVRTIVRK